MDASIREIEPAPGPMEREDEIRSSLSKAMDHIHFGRTDNTAKKTLKSSLLSARDTLRFLETVHDAKCRWNGHTTRCQTPDYHTEISLGRDRKREHLESELWSPGCTVRRVPGVIDGVKK